MQVAKPLVAITGASSGIGKAAAIAFAKKGYPLLLLARRVNLLEELKLPNAICCKADVQNYEALDAAVKMAQNKYGPIDLMINNAGIMPLGNVASQPLADQYTMIDVNIKGVLNGMHAVLPQMQARTHGTIINVTSVAGYYTIVNHGVYCGTKYAVRAISEQTRKEMAKYNVRVCLVAPGWVDTELLNITTDQQLLEQIGIARAKVDPILESEDIAQAMLYIYEQPQRVSIKELMISPTKEII